MREDIVYEIIKALEELLFYNKSDEIRLSNSVIEVIEEILGDKDNV